VSWVRDQIQRISNCAKEELLLEWQNRRARLSLIREGKEIPLSDWLTRGKLIEFLSGVETGLKLAGKWNPWLAGREEKGVEFEPEEADS